MVWLLLFKTTTLPMVTQKKIPGHPEESTIARTTVMTKMTTSTKMLPIIRVLRLPLKKRNPHVSICTYAKRCGHIVNIRLDYKAKFKTTTCSLSTTTLVKGGFLSVLSYAINYKLLLKIR